MELRERLAEYAHEAWSDWVEYLFRISQPHAPDVIIPAWAADRWARQMNTPYNGLPDGERDNDRKEADRILEITGVAEKDKRIAELEKSNKEWLRENAIINAVWVRLYDTFPKMADQFADLWSEYYGEYSDEIIAPPAIIAELKKRIAELEERLEKFADLKEKLDALERTLPDGYAIDDDATVELAIELSEAQKRIAELTEALDKIMFASTNGKTLDERLDRCYMVAEKALHAGEKKTRDDG